MLSKVLLINWMYFQKALLPINGNTAIVGINGTGKSTIIDAIQMLLLGAKQSKFNSNANAEKRTLESYVRGHIASFDKEYLRPNDVVTYLAMQVEVADSKYIFGINIEYKSLQNRLLDPRYFFIKNLELTEDLFITNDNFPKSYDVFNKEMKGNNTYITFPTLLSYQNKIKEVLGLKTDGSYFKILSRAIGIKNITECNKFMNEFVLDESIIDVTDIKKNILEMERVSKTIEREEEKLNALDNIVNFGEKLNSNLNEYKKLQYKRSIASIINLENEISNKKEEVNKLKISLEDEKKRKISYENDSENYYKSKLELENTYNNLFPDLMAKKEKLNQLENEYNNVHSYLNTFISRCNNELKEFKYLIELKNKDINNFINYLKLENYTTSSAKESFNAIRNVLKAILEEYSNEIVVLKNDIRIIRDEIAEIEDTIKSLENNQPKFNNTLLSFRDYIKKGLYDKYKVDVDVKFLCEYLDISNDEWRNAIEGYLGNQRFYLVVPNNYYKDALKLYNSNNNFYGIRIINGLRLPSFDSEKNTLGEYVIASNDVALNYARYILNRVHCVDNINDLDNYDISITRDCMCYQNYSVFRIDPKRYKESFIGALGLKKQLELKKEEYENKNIEASKLLTKYNELNEYKKLINNNINFLSEMIENNDYFNSIDRDSYLEKEINNLREKINFYQNDPKSMEILFEIDELEKSIEANKELIQATNNHIINFNSKIETYNNDITSKENEKLIYNDELDGIQELLLDSIKNELLDVKINRVYLANLNSSIRSLNDNNIKDKSDIENLMRGVRDKFNINLEPDFDLFNRYKDERNKINQNVFKSNSKLIEMRKSYLKLFFSEFLSKLNQSIENAFETIRNLNNSLSTFTFGNDYYSIKCDITSNLDLKEIYEYAKEFNSSNSDRGLFVDREYEDKKRQRVEELLNQYMFSDDIKTQNIVVDYRNYLYFDVLVHSNDIVKSLNRVIRSQSGGEVQVPFYILSGVAFKQTLDKRNKDALGIVLYDEAFDKMDAQRIQSMLQFYRDKLNIQVILAAPGKLDSLVDNMNTILAIVRDNDRAIVSDISHDI